MTKVGHRSEWFSAIFTSNHSFYLLYEFVEVEMITQFARYVLIFRFDLKLDKYQ